MLFLSSVFLLILSSSAYAAPAPPKATVTAYAREGTSNRPWFLQDFSRDVVATAISIRSPGVPVQEASEVAHTLVESALAHPQYTSIAQNIVDMFVDDGIYVNATSLYNIATEAQSAYNEIHTEPAYSSYIQYADAHATLYDLKLLAPSIPPRLNGAESARAREQRAVFTSIYASLASDPTGSAALNTLDNVVISYIRDLSRNRTASVNINMVESLLMRLLN